MTDNIQNAIRHIVALTGQPKINSNLEIDIAEVFCLAIKVNNTNLDGLPEQQTILYKSFKIIYNDLSQFILNPAIKSTDDLETILELSITLKNIYSIAQLY